MQPKLHEQHRARELRRDGLTYREIADRLGVATNSAYRWTHDIELDDEQRARNHRGPPQGQTPSRELVDRRATSWSTRCRARRAAYQDEGRRRARGGDDPLHLAGCMLYWAEGGKGRNIVHFANSDVAMVVLFARFLRLSLDVRSHRFRLSINAYTNNGLTIEEIEAHWLTVLELPETCVRKHVVNHYPTSSSGRAANRLRYGVCSLKLGDTHVLQHIYGAIQEYGRFTEPRWLG